MGLRVTKRQEAAATVIQIDGRLTAEAIDALLRTIQAAGPPLILDISNLQSADELAVETLRRVEADGIPLRGGSPYVELLLRGSAHKKKPGPDL